MLSKIKQLVNETLVYGILQIFGRFLTFLLTPLYTNFLTKSDNGDISYIWSILAFLNVIYSLGMESAFFRFYDKNDLEKSKSVFSHAYLVMLAISSAFTLLILLFSNALASHITTSSDGLLLLRISAFIPMIDTVIMIPFALLRITHKAKRFALTRFIAIFVTIILNYLFLVTYKVGIVGVAYAQLIGSLISFVVLFPEVLSNLKFKLDKLLIREMFVFGLPTVPAYLSSIILQIGDKPLMKEITGSAEQLGIYNANYKLGIPMMLAVTAFDYAWKPFYLNNYKEDGAKNLYSRILTYYTIICAIVFLLVSMFIPYLVRMPFIGGKFINQDYWVGIGIIPIILGAYFFTGVYSNISAGFNITKNTKYLSISVGISSILNIILNIVLIPHYSYYGAAWATFLAYFVNAMILYYYSLKIYPIQYEWKRISILILTTLGVYVISEFTYNNDSLLVMFAFKISLLCLFIFALYVLKFFTQEELLGMKKLVKRGK
ncbi:MAG: polysaccharide biosynthesis C-terminal domain-containing protein [Candidatus Kapabacteria bacterium]|nr:polysaccharide biosynthesis C-terminal domain-containing protein [Candidatus Kapabacteria bacterium]